MLSIFILYLLEIFLKKLKNLINFYLYFIKLKIKFNQTCKKVKSESVSKSVLTNLRETLLGSIYFNFKFYLKK